MVAKALGGGRKSSGVPRRNWLGRMQDMFITGPHAGNNWGVIAATLQDLGGDGTTSYYDDFIAARENRRRYDQQATLQAQAQKRENMRFQAEQLSGAREQEAAAARARALEGIPEELRPYAQLGIEGPITQYFRSRYPTPSRARTGAAAPALPDGFVWE